MKDLNIGKCGELRSSTSWSDTVDKRTTTYLLSICLFLSFFPPFFMSTLRIFAVKTDLLNDQEVQWGRRWLLSRLKFSRLKYSRTSEKEKKMELDVSFYLTAARLNRLESDLKRYLWNFKIINHLFYYKRN